jgi:hypothetical protein
VTTRPTGSVSRSSLRRSSSWSPSSDADSGVSTKPAAMKLTRTSATSSARAAANGGSAADAADEGSRFPRGYVVPCLAEPVPIAAGENHLGARGPGVPCCLKPDARAAAYHHDCLPGQFRLTLSHTPGMPRLLRTKHGRAQPTAASGLPRRPSASRRWPSSAASGLAAAGRG